MHYWNEGWHMGWMAVWWILGLTLLIALVIAVVWLVARNGGRSTRPPEPPEEALKRRYARGELSRDEYLRMRDELKA